MKIISRVYQVLAKDSEWLTVDDIAAELDTSSKLVDLLLRQLETKRWVQKEPQRVGNNGRPANLWRIVRE